MSFENQLVDTLGLLKMTVAYPLLVSILLFGVAFISARLLKGSVKASSVFRCFLKVFEIGVYIILILFVFFFDYKTKTFSLSNFPEKMPISSLFVGIFAIYEIIFSIFDCFISFSDGFFKKP